MKEMRWSKYNMLFTSTTGTPLLYNVLSNLLLELDPSVYDDLTAVKDGKRSIDPDHNPSLYAILTKRLVLTTAQAEQAQLDVRRYRRNTVQYGSSTLNLTIAPTMACNFRCPYCFQHFRRGTEVMDRQTAEALVEFVRHKHFRPLKKLSVSWYGGEPLLAFDRICALSEDFQSLGEAYEAGIITNGFLLDSKKAGRLKDLGISSVQVTIDGPEKYHNQRRIHLDRRPTYGAIMDNLGELVSRWEGYLSVRVNVDRRNKNNFAALKQTLEKTLGGQKAEVEVYPHPVLDAPGVSEAFSHKHDVRMSYEEYSNFRFQLAKAHGYNPKDGLLPPFQNFRDRLCVANDANGFVIGWDGGIYKCLSDLERPDRRLGSVHAKSEGYVTRPERMAVYTVGVDQYDDPECRACFFLPICGGGCANRRLEEKLSKTGDPINICTLYKPHFSEYLSLYFEAETKRRIGKNLWNTERALVGQDSFNVIHDGMAKRGSS